METDAFEKRQFIPLQRVQDVLSITSSQAYALVRSGEIRAIRIGGRRQWRVEVTELEDFIARSYHNPSEGARGKALAPTAAFESCARLSRPIAYCATLTLYSSGDPPRNT